MAATASSWALLALLALQSGGRKAPAPPPRPVYPFEVVPQDVLWGHLELGNFREPIGVCFEPQARELFVADSKNGLVAIFDQALSPVFSFGGAPLLIEPTGVVALEDGSLYVVDAARHELACFDYRGEPREPLVFLRPPQSEDEKAQPIKPRAVARDAQGHWYVIDRDEQRLFVFDAGARFVRELPPPQGATHFEVLSDVAVSAQGLVALADQRATPAIHVFDAAGKRLAAFGARDVGLDNFTAPVAVAFDEQGFLYAVDLLRHDVKVFMPDGQFVARFGGWFAPQTRGRAAGELLYPADIAIADGGPIFVAERFGQRVQVFERRAVEVAPASPQRSR